MFTHLLVPLDGAECSAHAIEPARSLAETSGARITLLTVIMQFPESRLPVPVLDQSSDARGRQYLEDVRATHVGTLSGPVDLVVRHGMPAETIAEVAMESQADLIVMSTHGTTGTRYPLGSTAWKILPDAPCPVLLMVAHRPLAQGQHHLRVPPETGLAMTGAIVPGRHVPCGEDDPTCLPLVHVGLGAELLACQDVGPASMLSAH